MILTIGMIVKNEEKYLEHCLKAIQPIRNSIDCELIITDTGSTDGTVGIAERFADKVLHFEWCNDFSAARNTTLAPARGEWFMFLDADDIFEDCEDIIKFFTTGEYRKYNSATYITRNLYDENDMNDYTLLNAARMTKRFDNTAFKGAIHESLNTYGAPVKALRSYAVHYGYAVTDKAKLADKFTRNYELLTKKYNEEKDRDSLICSQLYDCCILGERYDEAHRYLEEGIAWAKEHHDVVLTSLYCKKAYYQLVQKNFEAVLDACDEYFGMDSKIRPGIITADMEILAIQGTALYELVRYDDAALVFRRFFEVFDNVRSGRLVSDESFLMDYTASSDNCYVKYVCSYIDCVLKGSAKDYRKTVGYISALPLSKYGGNSAWTERLAELEMQLLDKVGFENAGALYRAFGSNGREPFLQKMKQTVFYAADKEPILKALGSVAGKEVWFDIYRRYFGGGKITAQLIESCVQETVSADDADILMIAMDKGLDISCILISGSFEPYKYAECGYRKFYGFHKAVDNYDVRLISDAGALPPAARFFAACMRCTVNFRSPKPGVYLILSANNAVEQFGIVGSRIKTECEIPDDDCVKAAVIMGDSVMNRRERNYKACIEDMKKAVLAYEKLAPFVSSYSKEVIDEYNEYANANNGNEMQRLINTVKNNIRSYIAAGNIAAAQKTLNEFGSIAPNDPDIPALRAEIDKRR